MFVVGVLGLTFLFQTSFLDFFYKKEKINTIENVANRIGSGLSTNNIEDVIDEISMSSEVCVRIVSNDQRYNVTRACTLKTLDNDTLNRMADDTIKNGGEKLFDNFKYQSPDLTTEDIYIYAKMINHDNQYSMILVSSMITPIAATISTLKSQYIIIVIIVLIMAIILALLLSRFIIKPIKYINEESKNISKGEYDDSSIKFITSEFDDLNKTLSKANNDIQKADKAKKELLGNVSHDLRTPLTMIVGYGEMIRDIKEENNEDNINVIIDEAKRLSFLVDDLIDISKLDDNNIELHKQEISINELLESVYHQYEKYCEAQNVAFKLELLKDKQVLIDANRIKQVLYNFINNSLNHNDKGSQEIVLGCELIENKYRIFVKDNGNGINEKDIDNIWDRYYKVDNEHKRYHIGSGIGLALSRQLLMAHELNYGVESIEGEYSKFYFDL